MAGKEAYQAEKNRELSEAEKIAVVPFVRELRGVTPDVLALRLALGRAQPSFLMERKGLSSLFLKPRQTLSIRDGVFTVYTDGIQTVVPGNPLNALQAHLEKFNLVGKGLPPFAAGAVGYLGYDCVQYLEKIPLQALRSSEDEASFLIFGEAILVDAKADRTHVVVNTFAGEAEPQGALDRLERLVRAALPVPVTEKGGVEKEPTGIDADGFRLSVKAVKEHILDGDIFQCVLSQKMEYDLEAEPLDVYQTLREVSPAPYQYYFETPSQTLLGASPELLVKVTGRLAETCPIAGTRPRGRTPAEDKKLERQLLRSPKETAEHLMLVDLSRNDLGRVCRPGTVRVRDFNQVQKFSHVMHIVSTVEGELVEGKTALSALFASFPAGTLTGAPKIRAMEIIATLEKKRRGAYGGAVVMYDFSGNLDSCITIRSLLVKEGKISVQAGAGIVADSTAARELKEIEHKSLAARRTLGLSEVRR